MKVLIVKLGAIGDIVHTLPALHAIRAAIPHAEISWAAEKHSAEILRGNSLIDNLIEVDTRSLRKGMAAHEILPEISRQVRCLREFGFDIAIDFQGLLKSAIIGKLSGAKTRFGFSKEALREPAGRIFYNRSVSIPPETHVIRKNLQLASHALNISVPDTDFDFPVLTNEENHLEAARIAEIAGGDFVILNPAGGWATKLWPAEKFGELADIIWAKHGLASIVTAEPGESELAGKALQNSRSSKTFVANPTLKGFFELAKLAKAYVGGDTGPTHLAIAAGTPVVGMFGPTEWWRNGSTNPDDVCVERLDIGCRSDCHRRTCSNWICMDITAETVLSAVSKRLGN
ncbi:MAG: lipopolysaccharide heptosyltransferase I [Pyrinomonadaceae bacterium]